MLSAHRRKSGEEVIDCLPAFKIVKERLDRNTRPQENGRAAHNIRIAGNDLICHPLRLLLRFEGRNGYALFQTANNTAVMTDVRPDQRGVISGTLNLSRNLGLINGASLMGAVFAFGSSTRGVAMAAAEAVAAGMRMTFAVAAVLIVVASLVAVATYRRGNRPSL